MPRSTVALFLSTLAVAGGTAACGHSPEAGEQGADKPQPSLSQPTTPLAVVDRNRLPSTIGVVLLQFVIGPQEWDPVLS